jgi:hypothetical protein
MQERRVLQRERVDLIATIVLDAGMTRLDGAVLDMTNTGARIAVHPDLYLPEEFYLLLPDHQMQPCRIVWRDGMSVGLQFND